MTDDADQDLGEVARARWPRRCRRRGRWRSGVVAVADDLGDDGGVPGAAGGGDPAGDVAGEDGGEDEACASAASRARRGCHRLAQVEGSRMAPAMTLNRMYHWAPSAISRMPPMLRLMPGLEEEPRRRTGRGSWPGSWRGPARSAGRSGEPWGSSPIHTPIGTQITVATDDHDHAGEGDGAEGEGVAELAEAGGARGRSPAPSRRRRPTAATTPAKNDVPGALGGRDAPSAGARPGRTGGWHRSSRVDRPQRAAEGCGSGSGAARRAPGCGAFGGFGFLDPEPLRPGDRAAARTGS